MRFPTLSSVLLATLSPSIVYADVKVTSPAAGAVVDLAGETQVAVTITWAESGTSPAITQLAGFSVALMAGGNTAGTFAQVRVLLTGLTMPAGLTQQVVIPSSIGASITDAYFFAFTSAIIGGGQVVNYSPRFSLNGLTGVMPAGVTVPASVGTAGPPTELTTAAAAAGTTTAAAGAAEYNVPYSLQTGPIRYAPMQGVPPTKITAKNPTPLFPTSAFTVATTYLPNPTVTTTMTESQTFVVTSIVNPAPAASQPGVAAAAQRFLERWKD